MQSTVGKTPINTLLKFGYCVGERVSKQVALGYGSCITAVEVYLRGGMNNLFGQKRFLINLEVRNNGNVFPG